MFKSLIYLVYSDNFVNNFVFLHVTTRLPQHCFIKKLVFISLPLSYTQSQEAFGSNSDSTPLHCSICLLIQWYYTASIIEMLWHILIVCGISFREEKSSS